MFFIQRPKTFKVGDTADCKINGEPAHRVPTKTERTRK